MHLLSSLSALLLFSLIFPQFCSALNQTASSSNQTASSPPHPPSPSPSPASRADVERCLERLFLRLRALNGPFLTLEQGVLIGLKSMEMYVAEKMSLEQIADYFYYNFSNLGLSPEQCQILADIYAGVVSIMGNSSNATDSLFYGGVSAAIGQIQPDKTEADAMIARMEGQRQGLTQIELAICRFSLPRITRERKSQIVQAISQLIPAEKRLAIRDQLRKAIRLD